MRCCDNPDTCNLSDRMPSRQENAAFETESPAVPPSKTVWLVHELRIRLAVFHSFTKESSDSGGTASLWWARQVTPASLDQTTSGHMPCMCVASAGPRNCVTQYPPTPGCVPHNRSVYGVMATSTQFIRHPLPGDTARLLETTPRTQLCLNQNFLHTLAAAGAA